MSEVGRLREGMLVRHKTQGYIGIFDGFTRNRNLFESPTDSIGCRVQVGPGPQDKRRVASPENLEVLTDLSLEE
ncbi:MAG TPA: hypothetical protein PKH26_02800, partial [Phycisphaerae bacterium]|nr:hypothetical protein [Phycisphaerae bacterium]